MNLNLHGVYIVSGVHFKEDNSDKGKGETYQNEPTNKPGILVAKTNLHVAGCQGSNLLL